MSDGKLLVVSKPTITQSLVIHPILKLIYSISKWNPDTVFSFKVAIATLGLYYSILTSWIMNSGYSKNLTSMIESMISPQISTPPQSGAIQGTHPLIQTIKTLWNKFI
jgi:hypothetical protein